MKARLVLSREVLLDLLVCDAENGILTWKYRDRKYFSSDRIYKAWNTRRAGKQAGHTARIGTRVVVQVGIFGSLWYAHRLIWVMVYGEDPGDLIDHKDGDSTNNRIDNLRKGDKSKNAANAKRPKHNTSGLKGAMYNKRLGKFLSQIVVQDDTKHLGYHATAEEAHEAYKKAALLYFGESANFGDAK